MNNTNRLVLAPVHHHSSWPRKPRLSDTSCQHLSCIFRDKQLLLEAIKKQDVLMRIMSKLCYSLGGGERREGDSGRLGQSQKISPAEIKYHIIDFVAPVLRQYFSRKTCQITADCRAKSPRNCPDVSPVGPESAAGLTRIPCWWKIAFCLSTVWWVEYGRHWW